MNILLLDIALADKTGCRIKDVNFAFLVWMHGYETVFPGIIAGTAKGVNEAIGCTIGLFLGIGQSFWMADIFGFSSFRFAHTDCTRTIKIGNHIAQVPFRSIVNIQKGILCIFVPRSMCGVMLQCLPVRIGGVIDQAIAMQRGETVLLIVIDVSADQRRQTVVCIRHGVIQIQIQIIQIHVGHRIIQCHGHGRLSS